MEDKIKRYSELIENAITIGEKSKYLSEEEIIKEYGDIAYIASNTVFEKQILIDEIFFLNALGRNSEIRYLQTGVKWGVHLFSFLFNNKIDNAFAIDDFGGPVYADDVYKEFVRTKLFFTDVNVTLFKDNYFNLSKNVNSELSKINFYFHNGNHNYINQSKTLPYYYECLDEVFIFMTNMWRGESTQHGTQKAIKDSGATLIDKWIYNNNFYVGIFKK